MGSFEFDRDGSFCNKRGDCGDGGKIRLDRRIHFRICHRIWWRCGEEFVDRPSGDDALGAGELVYHRFCLYYDNILFAIVYFNRVGKLGVFFDAIGLGAFAIQGAIFAYQMALPISARLLRQR